MGSVFFDPADMINKYDEFYDDEFDSRDAECFMCDLAERNAYEDEFDDEFYDDDVWDPNFRGSLSDRDNIDPCEELPTEEGLYWGESVR